jgi:hypothetical protein
MGIQLRPRGSNDPLYSPDRDLAYCSAKLVGRAMVGLDEGHREKWISDAISA